MGAADLCLLLVYGAVVAYFVGRFVQYRVKASLGVALLPSGWFLVALHVQAPAHALAVMKWCGVSAGVVLLALVLHADRGDTRR